MEKTASACAIRNNTKESSELTQMVNREEQRRMHHAIASTKPPKYGKGVSKIEGPPIDDPDGEWTCHSTQSTVEQAGLQFLDRHFRQANDTPPMQEPFLSEFGLLADTPATEQVLAGTYDAPPDMDPHLVDLLGHMTKPPDVQDLAEEIGREEYQSTWKHRVKQRASSSPHNHHLAHFMAIARDNSLSTMMAQIMSIPQLSGFSPTLYRMMIACILEKKPGVIRIDKQRFIFLLDAIYSGSCRITARRSAAQAMKHQLIAMEQFGCQKNLEAKLHAINLRVVMDLTVQLRTPAAIVCNDLTCCFDRIIHSITAIVLRRVGHKRGPIVCRFYTTQQMIVNLRSSFGDSSISNRSGLWLVPTD